MNPIEEVKQWFLSVALAKAIKRAVQLGAAYGAALILATPQLLAVVSSLAGAPVTPEMLELALTAGLNSVFEVLRNWLKQKFPEKLGWL